MTVAKTPAALVLRDVRHGYGAREVLRGINVTIAPGELVGIMGRNGAGKTTLLHLLSGLRTPNAGTVEVLGDATATLDRTSTARRVALVSQKFHWEFPFSVRELVAMGRTPFLGRFEREHAADRDAIDAAMRATDLTSLSERPITELSGGEQQRVALARALAQDTPVLVLDEPASSLDLLHTHELFRIVQDRVGQGRTAICALHDIALARRFCNRILLLHEGTVFADGSPAETLTPPNVETVFGLPLSALSV